MTHVEIWNGSIEEEERDYTEDYIINGKKLIDPIIGFMGEHGRFLSVRYALSEKPIESIEKIMIEKMYGRSEADITPCFGSEWTGYMWTDKELTVGGHNIVDEIIDPNCKRWARKGKYLFLEITFNDTDVILNKQQSEGGQGEVPPEKEG